MLKLNFILFAAILMLAQSGFVQAQTRDVSTELIAQVEAIKIEQGVDARRMAAETLANGFRDFATGTVNNSAVLSLASLLADPDDEVRFSAVEALSFIGAEARQAAPAIETAIRDKHYLVGQPHTGTSKMGFYCATLTIIGQWSQPEDCSYWLH